MVQQERARRTRERILNLTAESFAAQGFTRTNLKDVAKALGMTTGALYGHFTNKEAIADALEREAAEHWALLRGAADYPGLAPEQALDSAVFGLVRAMADPRMRAVVRLAAEGPPRGTSVPNLLDAVAEFLLAQLRRAWQDDAGPARTWRPEPVTQILLGLICGAVFARRGATEEESQSDWEEAARVLLGALREDGADTDRSDTVPCPPDTITYPSGAANSASDTVTYPPGAANSPSGTTTYPPGTANSPSDAGTHPPDPANTPSDTTTYPPSPANTPSGTLA
ncbi:TetR family transcriptional regulator [Streptomyces formicae]